MDSGEAKAIGGGEDCHEKMPHLLRDLSRLAHVLEISGSWQEVNGKLKSDDCKGCNEGIICKVWLRYGKPRRDGEAFQS